MEHKTETSEQVRDERQREDGHEGDSQQGDGQQDKYLQEVLEQPGIIRNLIRDNRLAATLQQIEQSYASNSRELIFVGMGSSHFAATAIQSRLDAVGVRYRLCEAGELLHYGLPGIPDGSWIVAVSQSGESYETKQVVEALRDRAGRVTTITNHPDSTLAQLADDVLLMGTGSELGSSSKTYIATLVIMHLLTSAFTQDGSVTVEDLGAAADWQAQLAHPLPAVANQMADALNISVGEDGAQDALHLLARGPMLATANQCALVLAEGTDTFTQALSGGAFRHGPYEIAGPAHRCVVFAPAGRTQHLMVGIAEEMAEMGSKVVLLLGQGQAEIAQTNGLTADQLASGGHDYAEWNSATVQVRQGSGAQMNLLTVSLPHLKEEVAPIAYFLPMELFLRCVALRKNRTPGMLRKMDKVTTRE